jgi:beta-glucosidase
VLTTGRPLVLPRLAEQATALLVAWHGGIRAGQAVADLLFGAAEPSGRLTASWPRAEGQIPVYYAHKNTGRPAEGEGTLQFDEPFKSTYLDEPNAPLFPFGFGLSYTSFRYTDLLVETPEVGLQGRLLCSARISNDGDRRHGDRPVVRARCCGQRHASDARAQGFSAGDARAPGSEERALRGPHF